MLKRMMKDSLDFGGSQEDEKLVSVAELSLALYVLYTPKQFFRSLSPQFLIVEI